MHNCLLGVFAGWILLSCACKPNSPAHKPLLGSWSAKLAGVPAVLTFEENQLVVIKLKTQSGLQQRESLGWRFETNKIVFYGMDEEGGHGKQDEFERAFRWLSEENRQFELIDPPGQPWRVGAVVFTKEG